MSRLRIRERFFFPSVLALAILVNGILASNFTLQTLNDYPGLAKEITQSIELTESTSDTSKERKDESKADEYAYYAENLADLVSKGKMSPDVRESLLDNFEPEWS